MTERPILFSGEMVRAILEGRKTQTRRIIKNLVNTVVGTDYCFHETKDGKWEVGFDYVPETGSGCFLRYINCPYGQPGDRLWVRESCRAYELSNGLDGVIYEADYLKEEQFVHIGEDFDSVDRWLNLYHYHSKEGAAVPSIHMPRWASRILLEVVSIRVERVKDISLADINAEGTPYALDATKRPYGSRREQFQRLWDSINEKRGYSWEVNPWVWVVEFTKCGGK